MTINWTDFFFWPALVAAWLAMVLGVVAAFVPDPFLTFVTPVTISLGAFAAVLFVLVLFDTPTRRAVDAFNRDTRRQWRRMTWSERLFSLGYGDRRLLIVNRIVLVEFLVFTVAERSDLALLCFASFFLSTVMLMLMLKRMPDIDTARG